MRPKLQLSTFKWWEYMNYQFLRHWNRIMERRMPLLTPVCVLLGVLLASPLHSLTFAVPWVFAFLTFSGSLSSNFYDLKQAALRPLPLLICMLVLHVILPAAAVGAGHLFFADDAETRTGLILAFLIPTGVVSFMWVSMYKGNSALTLSIILLDTLLAPIIVPIGLELAVGTSVHMDAWAMIRGLLMMVVLPALAGTSLNHFTRGQAKQRLSAPLSPFAKTGLMIVIMINSSVAAPYLDHFHWKLVWILMTVFGLAFCSYRIGWMLAKSFHWDNDIVISLTFNCGMRNISAGAVLAVTYFAPAVSIPVIVCTLFQQLLASVYAIWLKRRYLDLQSIPE